jgi:hypothetical protein
MIALRGHPVEQFTAVGLTRQVGLKSLRLRTRHDGNPEGGGRRSVEQRSPVAPEHIRRAERTRRTREGLVSTLVVDIRNAADRPVHLPTHLMDRMRGG